MCFPIISVIPWFHTVDITIDKKQNNILYAIKYMHNFACIDLPMIFRRKV